MKDVFEEIVEASPDGVTRFDARGRIVYVNPAAERFMGMPRGDILGKTNLELGFGEGLASLILEAVRRALETGETVVRCFPFDGAVYESHFICTGADAKGKPSVSAYTRDISAREQLADLLRKDRHFAEEVLIATHEPMLVLDSDLRVLSGNEAFHRYFQTNPPEVEGRPFEDVAGAETGGPAGLREHLSRVLEEDGEIRELELEMNIPRLGRRIMSVHAKQIDHLRMILFSLLDVTERTHAMSDLQRDLHDRNNILDRQSRRLRELMVELSETEDRERQRLAELLHDEIQQMLVAVGFKLQLAEREVEAGGKAAGLLNESREVLQSAIDQSRDLSHEISPATFRSEGLERGLCWLAGQMERQQGLRVEVRVEGEVDELAAPLRILLYKAVREMLFNIVKHAEVFEAGLRVRRTGDQVEVVVRDHGKGFDAGAVLDQPSGRGLGLFNIRERLAALNGTLEVESLPGKGSTFRMRVPLSDRLIEKASERSRELVSRSGSGA